jgi:hypothetical protein
VVATATIGIKQGCDCLSLSLAQFESHTCRSKEVKWMRSSQRGTPKNNYHAVVEFIERKKSTKDAWNKNGNSTRAYDDEIYLEIRIKGRMHCSDLSLYCVAKGTLLFMQ